LYFDKRYSLRHIFVLSADLSIYPVLCDNQIEPINIYRNLHTLKKIFQNVTQNENLSKGVAVNIPNLVPPASGHSWIFQPQIEKAAAPRAHHGGGTASYVSKIYYSNLETIGPNPNIVYPGQKLYIPD
jgi:hypothetical protein